MGFPENINAYFNALERLRKEEKTPRERIGRSDKPGDDDDITALTQVLAAIAALEKTRKTVLKPAANTLVDQYKIWWNGGQPEFPTVPTYVTKAERAPEPGPLVHAVTCSTVQRLARHWRRYPWLEDKDFLRSLNDHV